ncbi:MAG TPA: MFS transporter [Prolixibacteraceae bacterium]|nr:MFS transporter [Prolixibacteraceae bacterium]
MNIELKQRWNNFPLKPARFPFFYGWVILFAGTVGVLVSAPGQTMGVSVFTDYLIDAIGISRIELSLAYMIGTVASSFLLTWAGKMYDEYGARIVGVVVSVFLGFILLLFSRVDQIIIALGGSGQSTVYTAVAISTLVILFFMLRFAGQGVLTMVSRNMMMKWFIRKRGFVNGISAVFVSFGFAIAPVSFNHFIEEFSWKGAYLIMAACIAILFSLFVFLFFRDNPEDLGMTPDGEITVHTDKDVIVKAFKQFTLKEARHTYSFWLFSLPMAVYALYFTGFTFHLVSIFENVGLNKEMALSVFVPMSFVSVFISFAGGWISDKIKLKYLLYAITIGQVIALFSLGHLDNGIFYYGFIIGNGVCSGLYSVLMAVTWPRFYGRNHLGRISGQVMAIIVFASAFGPVFFSFSNRTFGGYQFAFYIVMVISAVLFLLSFKAENPQIKFRNQTQS